MTGRKYSLILSFNVKLRFGSNEKIVQSCVTPEIAETGDLGTQTLWCDIDILPIHGVIIWLLDQQQLGTVRT